MKKMKKIQGLPAIVLIAFFLVTACPMNEETGDDDSFPAPVFKTKEGRYLNNTLVDITHTDPDAVIYYVINSEAAPGSTSTEFKSSSKIKLEFDTLSVNEITVKAIAEKQGKYSKVISGTFTKLNIGLDDLSAPMRSLAAEIAAAPATTEAAPYTLRVPASITLDDVKLELPNPDLPNVKITDGLGALFVAFQGKHIKLDLSEVTWKGPDPYGDVSGNVQKVPACNQAAWELRPDRDKLVEVIFPKDIVIVEIHAFHGCENIKKLDFSNCNQLRTLDEYAFSDNKGLEILDLSGCTELKRLEQYVFSRPEKLKYLDLSDTKVDNIGKWGFQHCYSLEYIEFPESLREMHDYCFQRPSSLKYVRFRGELWRPIFNWCNFLYYMDANPSFNGREVTHRVQQPEATVRDATDQNFVIFAPDTPYWDSGEDNLFYFNTGASYHHGQHVALPKKNGSITTPGGTFSYASFDGLRGNDLLQAAEPYRGLASLTFNFQNIKDGNGDAVNGTITVRALSGVENPPSYATGGQFDAFKRVDMSTVSMSGGNATVTVGTPDQSQLNVLNTFNAQQLTGRYDRVGTQSEQEKWMNKTHLPYDAYTTVNGVSGYDTEPSIWPQNTVKFAVLELEVTKQDGTKGYLQQQGESVLRLDGRVYDYRTVRYVWVSEDCTVYRRNRGASGNQNPGGTAGQSGNTTNVYMTLKRGWNLWDVQKQYVLGDLYTGSPSQADLKAKVEEKVAAGTPPGVRIRNLIGTGKQPYQDPAGAMDDLGKPQNYNPGSAYSSPVQWKEVPWVFTDAPYKYPD
jgi:hypothetical protein